MSSSYCASFTHCAVLLMVHPDPFVIAEFPKLTLRIFLLHSSKLSKEMLSRNFPCEAADDRVQFKLKIHLYPNVNDQAGSFISVYLVYCGKDEEVRANFEIAIVDDKGLKKNQR